jgi:hypothetical protein
MLAALAVAAGLLPCHGSALRHAVVPDVDDFGLDQSVWLGWEEPDDPAELQNVTGALASSSSSSHAAAVNITNGGGPPLLMLGLHNTGTNLLARLMEMNGIGSPPFHAGLKIWKHVRPDLLEARFRKEGRLDDLKKGGLVTVVVIRDPMSWIQSMRKAPYDLKGCLLRKNWATSPCYFPAPHKPGTSIPKFKGIVAHEETFHLDNIESVWNEWTRQYGELASYGWAPGKSLMVSYEELVLDTEATLGRIAAAAGRPRPTDFKQLRTPAKSHGMANGRAMALKKLHNKPYLH